MRLIDADALLKLCRFVPVHDGEGWTYTNIVTDGDVMSAPTINPEDLRPKGRWLHDINNLYGCSECTERETMSPKRMKRFCPNCGAKMEE